MVCDAQGGRTDYHDYLSRAIPGSRVTTLEQSSARSRYVIEGELPCAIGGEVVMSGAESGEPDGECESASPRWERKPRAITITFMPEAETSHLPVALASMLAKLTRELMMHRFNRYWTGRMPDLKPTAGYTLDARRWLADVGDRVSRTERATLVRRA